MASYRVVPPHVFSTESEKTKRKQEERGGVDVWWYLLMVDTQKHFMFDFW